jgi:hypothetical protein
MSKDVWDPDTRKEQRASPDSAVEGHTGLIWLCRAKSCSRGSKSNATRRGRGTGTRRGGFRIRRHGGFEELSHLVAVSPGYLRCSDHVRETAYVRFVPRVLTPEGLRPVVRRSVSVPGAATRPAASAPGPRAAAVEERSRMVA